MLNKKTIFTFLCLPLLTLEAKEILIYDYNKEVKEVNINIFKEKKDKETELKFVQYFKDQKIKSIDIDYENEDIVFLEFMKNNNLQYFSNINNKNNFDIIKENDFINSILFEYFSFMKKNIPNEVKKTELNKLKKYIQDLLKGDIKNSSYFLDIERIQNNFSKGINSIVEVKELSKKLFLDEFKYFDYLKHNYVLNSKNNQKVSIYEKIELNMSFFGDGVIFAKSSNILPIVLDDNNEIEWENETYFLHTLVYPKIIKNSVFFNIHNNPFVFKKQILYSYKKHFTKSVAELENEIKIKDKIFNKTKNKWDFLELIVLTEILNIKEKDKKHKMIINNLKEEKKLSFKKINIDYFSDKKLYFDIYEARINEKEILFLYSLSNDKISISIVNEKHFIKENRISINNNNMNLIFRNSRNFQKKY